MMIVRIEMDQKHLAKREKFIRTVCSASIIWGNNHHFHLHQSLITNMKTNLFRFALKKVELTDSLSLQKDICKEGGR
jgi:hypothetical protein